MNVMLGFRQKGDEIMENTSQNQNTVKFHNILMVLNLIRDNNSNENFSRAYIARKTSMSPTSITRITSTLIDLGLVKQTERFSRGVGRKGTLLRIVEDAFYSLGISIDSDYINLCILDFLGNNFINEKYELDDRVYTPREIVEITKNMFENIIRENKKVKDLVKVIGVSCIGNVDYITGDVYFAPQLKWNTKFNLKNMVEETFNMPAYIDNNIKSALIGATYHSEKMKSSDVAYISIGTGVGVSVMYDGKIIRGMNNAAGEMGHTIFNPNGRECSCGRRGCLSSYLTKKSLIESSNKMGNKVEDMGEIMEAFIKKDKLALELIDNLTSNIAIMISNVIYTYNPRYLLVSGSTITEYPILYDIAVEKTNGMIHENLYKDIIIRSSNQKIESCTGIAHVAQNHYVKNVLKEHTR